MTSRPISDTLELRFIVWELSPQRESPWLRNTQKSTLKRREFSIVVRNIFSRPHPWKFIFELSVPCCMQIISWMLFFRFNHSYQVVCLHTPKTNATPLEVGPLWFRSVGFGCSLWLSESKVGCTWRRTLTCGVRVLLVLLLVRGVVCLLTFSSKELSLGSVSRWFFNDKSNAHNKEK